MRNKPMTSVGRLEVRLQRPNKVFETWLQKWLQDAEAKGSKSAEKLREALHSLQLYPLPLASGRECSILKGFHTSLCNMIDEEMLKRKSKCQAIAGGVDAYERDLQKLAKSATKIKTVSKCRKPKVQKLSKKALKAIEEENDRLKNVVMHPGLFRIVLAVDCQETNGKNKKTLDNTRAYLESLQVEYEVRRLVVGDFLWIARDNEGSELVLPYIVERKRMDDLASSVRDGRFHEQKHRLKQSSIPNIIYLIEDYNDNENLGVPVDNLKQALTNTLIHNQFSVVHTENHRRSISYLRGMTQMLIKTFKNKCLMSANTENITDYLPIKQDTQKLMKFRALAENSSRNAQLTIGEVFVQQLLQLHSLSLEKCLAIVAIYPTPSHLIQAYRQCDASEEPESLLASMRYGETQRPIGQKISEILYNFYGKEF